MGGDNAFSRTDRRLIERAIRAMEQQAEATERLADEIERLRDGDGVEADD